MAKIILSIDNTFVSTITGNNQGLLQVSDYYNGEKFSSIVYKKKNVDSQNYYRCGNDFIYMVGTYMEGGKKPLSTLKSLLENFQVDDIASYKKTIVGMWCVLIHKDQKTYMFNDYYGLYDTCYTHETVSNSLVDCVRNLAFCKENIDEYSYIMDLFQLGSFPGYTPFTYVKKLKGNEYLEISDAITVHNVKGDLSFHYKYESESESLKILEDLLVSNASMINDTFGKPSLFMTGGLDSRLVFASFSKAGVDFDCKYGSGKYTQSGDAIIVKQISDQYCKELEIFDWNNEAGDLISDKEHLFEQIGFYNYIDSGSLHRHRSFSNCSKITPFYAFGYFCEAIRLRDWAEEKGETFSLTDYVDNYYLNNDLKSFYNNFSSYRNFVIETFKNQLAELGWKNNYDKIPVDLFESFRWKMSRFCDSRMEFVLNNYGYAFSLLSIPAIHELILSLPANVIRDGKFQVKLINRIDSNLIRAFDVFSHLRWYYIDKNLNKRKKITLVNVADAILKQLSVIRPYIMKIYKSYRYGTADTLNKEQQFCIESKNYIPSYIDVSNLKGSLNRLTAFIVAIKHLN